MDIKMNRFIICVTILVVHNSLIANAEKFIVVIPTRQIRRSPTLPANVPRPNVPRGPAYLKLTPYNPYGPVVRQSAGIPLHNHNHLPHGTNDYEQAQTEGINRAVMPYGKPGGYPIYSRGYVPYDKLKGGLVPLINQNSRYPPEPNRPRQQGGPGYGPIPGPNVYYHRQIDSNPYHTDKTIPTRLQPIDRPHQQTFVNQQQLQQQPIGNEDPSLSQRSPQPAASNNYPRIGPIIVKGPSSISTSSNQQESTRAGDLQKESSSSNVVGKVPTTPSLGVGNGGIVLRDTILLDDYEKEIAEFTKSWPKLSAFPGNFGSTSSFFPGSSGQSLSAGVARSSNNLDSSNSIGRQGYAVKEEIDEPPVDFRTMPIITSPLHVHPVTPSTISLYKNIFG